MLTPTDKKGATWMNMRCCAITTPKRCRL